MRTLTRPTRKTRPLTIPTGFIWLKHLTSEDQADFVSGLLARVVSAIKNNDWSSVSEWVEEWKATANILAEPQIARGIRQGRNELAQGDSVDWESLRKELGL